MGSVARQRRRLAAERDAAAVYRALASRRKGEEREVLLALARAEERHAAYWDDLLGASDGPGTGATAARPRRPGWRTRLLAWMARRIGSLLVLALVQRAELRGVVEEDGDVPAVIAADEQVHARVVAGLARSRRARASGLLRASVFGANDGLVSNLSLVLGVAAAGVAPEIVLLTGIAGLLAGALSMAAGEYVSVRSQRELVDARPPRLEPAALAALREEGPGELALAFRAEGLPPEEADRRAAALLAGALEDEPPPVGGDEDADLIGTAAGAAGSSFVSFATGAALPLIPFVLAEGTTAVVAAVVLAGASLFVAGALAGVLSGGPLLRRGARQLGIGLGAAAVTYALGSLFGVTLG